MMRANAAGIWNSKSTSRVMLRLPSTEVNWKYNSGETGGGGLMVVCRMYSSSDWNTGFWELMYCWFHSYCPGGKVLRQLMHRRTSRGSSVPSHFFTGTRSRYWGKDWILPGESHNKSVMVLPLGEGSVTTLKLIGGASWSNGSMKVDGPQTTDSYFSQYSTSRDPSS